MTVFESEEIGDAETVRSLLEEHGIEVRLEAGIRIEIQVPKEDEETARELIRESGLP